MSREYTQQELQQIIEAENILRTRGLIVDDKDGKELAAHNAERIAAYFDLNLQTPIDVATLLKACDDMRDQMYWKSAAQMEADEVISHLKPDQAQIALGWFKRQTRIVTEGDEGYKNVAEVIGWLIARKYAITEQGLQTALTNVQATRGTITWKEAPKQESQGRPGHKDDGSGFLRDEKNPRYRNGKINHAYQEPGKQEAPKNNTSVDAWESLAKQLLNRGTHSQQAAFRATYDHAVAQGKSWREIYAEMNKLRASYERVVPRAAA
jgi:hypothetical protein